MDYIYLIIITILVILLSGNSTIQKNVKPEVAAVITWTLALLLSKGDD